MVVGVKWYHTVVFICISLMANVDFQKVSPMLWAVLSLSSWRLWSTKFLYSVMSSLSIIYSCVCVALASYLRNPLANHKAWKFTSVGVFLRILALTFRYLICFELFFCMTWGRGSNFIISHLDIQLLQHHLLKKHLFPHWIVLAP